MTHELVGKNPDRQAPKIVVMPSREDMLQKLQASGLYGITPQTDRFYDRFIEQLADSEKVGIGLVMAWELAGYDTLREYPPIISLAVGMSFEKAIDAVTPNTDVAKDAKEFRKKVADKGKDPTS